MGQAETGQVYRGDLDKLLRKIGEERGLDLGQYRRQYLERRLATRLRALGLHTYRQYAQRLDLDPGEYASLLDTLTVNVTDFFRDPTVYQRFRHEIVPALLETKLASRHRMIRAWSAGCATGEEPYSITMSVLDAIERSGDSFLLSVYGTDLDPGVLEAARRAEYRLEALRHVPPVYRAKYVETLGDRFRLMPVVTDHVRFSLLNLFEDRPINVVDVIFCRNVFIYFTRQQQERVLDRFWTSLSRGGYLVLGRSEKLANSFTGRFELVSGKERIYRKPGGP
ncbi:MAG: protein-glutamate O-methyltransferase CheR [Coriobacteriia bacterium]|nr:protein-glutamate O-methyltransferase CheR [Coriobacteriia bacterium]